MEKDEEDVVVIPSATSTFPPGSPKKDESDVVVIPSYATSTFPLGSLKSPLLDFSGRKQIQPNVSGAYWERMEIMRFTCSVKIMGITF